MGKTRYAKCVELLNMLKEQGIEEISIEALEKQIRMNIGDDIYRTIKPCMRLIFDTDLIEKGEEDGQFKIK